jgi:hypothetical protein
MNRLPARRHKSHKKKKTQGGIFFRAFSPFVTFVTPSKRSITEVMIEMLAYRSVSIVKLAPAGNVIPKAGAKICDDFFQSLFYWR